MYLSIFRYLQTFSVLNRSDTSLKISVMIIFELPANSFENEQFFPIITILISLFTFPNKNYWYLNISYIKLHIFPKLLTYLISN